MRVLILFMLTGFLTTMLAACSAPYSANGSGFQERPYQGGTARRERGDD